MSKEKKNEKNNSVRALEVRPIPFSDEGKVIAMDWTSGFDVEQFLEDNEDFAWGAYLDGKLIGYCTLGYADDCCDLIEKHPVHTSDSLLLSDVFVLPDFRHHGYGTQMVASAIQKRRKIDRIPGNPVFVQLMTDQLKDFYSPIGFEVVALDEHGFIEGGVMLKVD